MSAQRTTAPRWLKWSVTGGALLTLLVVWQAYISLSGAPPLVLPPPADVGGALLGLMGDAEFYGHVGVTLMEVAIGFSIAIVVGVGLGVALGKSPLLRASAEPLIVGLQVLPKVALVPLFILWFGFGVTSKIILSAVFAFFPILTNTVLGVRSIDQGHREVMTTLGASRWQRFRELELPSALPYILTGMEVGIVLSVTGAIVGEYLGGSAGLGHLVVAALNAFDTATMFAVILALTVIGFLLYALVSTLRRWLTPWHESSATKDL